MENNSGLRAVVRTFNMFGDLVLLNLCCIVCCLPIITIGPAITALFYAIMRLDETEGGIIKLYFKGFRTEFIKNLFSGLFILILLAATGIEAYILYATDNLTGLPLAIICILLFWILSIAAYLFPLNARFSNGFWKSIRNALLLSITNFPKTIAMIIINVIQIVLYIWKQDLLGKVFILALALSFSAPAYFDSLFLKKIFKPFLEPAPVKEESGCEEKE